MAKENEYLIRELGPDDAAEFKALRLKGLKEEPDAFGSSFEESEAVPIATFAERIASNQNGFVLGAFDKAMVGMTGFYRYKDGKKSEHKGVLWGVYLLPEYRGKGIAKRLLLGVIEKARKLPGIELIHLGVNPANVPVVKLYESVGFVKWGEEKHALKVDGHYVDEDQMVLWL
jgi:RimJ/RimL family protein N-acetyltransferase